MPDLKLTYQGNVSADGVITLPKRLRKEVTAAFLGKEIEVVFMRHRKRRSSPQNKYYWGVMIPEVLRGMIDCGNDALQMGNSEHVGMVHEYLKIQLLDNGQEIHNIDGEIFKLPPTTTKCTTVEFDEYMERVRRWAGEFLGITIPLPGEQAEMFLEQNIQP